MAESQELLDRKQPPPYLWKWERKRVSLNNMGDNKEASCFMGLLQHESSRSVGYNGPKFWQIDTDHVYESETVSEEISESQSEHHDFNGQSIKSEQSMERISESLESEQSGSPERTIHVEIQPFANEPINGAELMTAVMGIRCCGLLRWELDPDEPHTPLALNFLVTVDKDVFDVHNLAVEMDQTLLNFATCSVAIKGQGSRVHHYLVGGSINSPEALQGPDEKPSSDKGHSKMRKFFPSKSFFTSLFSFKSSCSSRTPAAVASSSLIRRNNNGGSALPASSSARMSADSTDDLTLAMQEISCDLKSIRKEVQEVQNHICFLSRHISNVYLLNEKLSNKQQNGHERTFTPMYGLHPSNFTLKPDNNVGAPMNGKTYGSVADNPSRRSIH